ncbi:hypothetical protein HKT18_06640 [Flavobacterium sp. IMCC34852]|uniref:Carboxypeptidase-like regulatory domain-containing protein n=1 Tax=Flavobacterium rivulicola TaxID=2732161 RepID=A0A7Y3R8L1_9FLAO|nr:hypothetical protein [Flavobacterium sp. IMCC34852]NNT71888.1 hypothetical protein [Flavobacterium sp. IMCC34852]
MNYFFKIIGLLLTVTVATAQNNIVKTSKGKVVSESVDLDGIYIINLKSNAATATEKEGYFTLKVSVGDTLMFSAIQIKSKKIVVSQEDFDKDLFLVKLEPMVNKLDELVIKQYKNINAVSLGIISQNTKHYTPAERKLRTASGDGISGNTNGSSGASAGLDPLFNWMSGRTAMLQKELEVERKETMLQKIENQFSMDYFVKKLKIPEEYVKGFWYYVVEDSGFVNAMNLKNKTMATFVLAELAIKYADLLKAEDK